MSFGRQSALLPFLFLLLFSVAFLRRPIFVFFSRLSQLAPRNAKGTEIKKKENASLDIFRVVNNFNKTSLKLKRTIIIMFALASASSSFFAQSVVARGSTSSNKKKSVYKVYANADMMNEVGTAILPKDAIKAERYVASNRFKLQKGKGPHLKKMGGEKISIIS